MKTLLRTIGYSAFAGFILVSADLCPNADAASTNHFPNVCAELRSGATLLDIETSLLTAGYSESDAGTFAGNTIRAHCPEQIPIVLAQI